MVLNSRYGGHWKLEKVFFNESVLNNFATCCSTPMIFKLPGYKVHCVNIVLR